MSESEEKIQIVSFYTNDTNYTPIDILQILLDQYTHTVVKKSRHAIAFMMALPDSIKQTKIMMCSVLNLTKEYTGITDVNCYLVFIDLKNENSKETFNLIISFLKDYCDLGKKIFVLGIVNKDNDIKQIISEKDIINIMDSGNFIYEYIEIDLEKTKEVADSFLNIFIKCSKEEATEDNKIEKDGKQAHSCNVF